MILPMKIPIGNYLITSDEMNIVLNERKIRGKKSENAGEEYYSPIGYFSTMESCLESLFERKIRAVDAATISELLFEIKNISKFIRSEFKKARGKDKK